MAIYHTKIANICYNMQIPVQQRLVRLNKTENRIREIGTHFPMDNGNDFLQFFLHRYSNDSSVIVLMPRLRSVSFFSSQNSMRSEPLLVSLARSISPFVRS